MTKRFLNYAALATIAALATPCVAAAAEPSGFHAEVLADLDGLQQKMVSLAEAVPAEDYDWRPADGVRSVREAFLHVATANHRMLEELGATPPENLQEMDSIGDKAAVVAALEDSYAAVAETLRALAATELDEQVDLFGRQWTKRQVAYLIATHGHEHLGQTIAYARSVGVTPPWSQSEESDESS